MNVVYGTGRVFRLSPPSVYIAAHGTVANHRPRLRFSLEIEPRRSAFTLREPYALRADARAAERAGARDGSLFRIRLPGCRLATPA
jgi:hypothetical protein